MNFKGNDKSLEGFLQDYNEAEHNKTGTREGAHPEFKQSDQVSSSNHYQSAAFFPASLMASRRAYHNGEHQVQREPFSWFVLMLTVTSALGGFLFGYDTGVVSGAMLLIREEFDLSRTKQEIVVSITIVGAVVASLSGGVAMEYWGRRPVILAAAFIFTVGAVLLAAAMSFEALVAGRLVVGLGIGLASLATPVYIAEAAPSHMRGTLVTLNTLLITVGQVTAGIVDGLFSGSNGGWRYMLGLSGLPSVLMMLGFLFLPESPRWLVASGRRREALSVLQRIRGVLEVHTELEEMIESSTDHSSLGSSRKESATVRSLIQDPLTRRALILGCGLQLLQQLSGINTVMYYSATIA